MTTRTTEALIERTLSAYKAVYGDVPTIVETAPGGVVRVRRVDSLQEASDSKEKERKKVDDFFGED